MTYIIERRDVKLVRRVAVGRVCDVCGRKVRGQARLWWRLAVSPSHGPRRERLRRLRHLHICSARCLLHKLGAAHKGTRVNLRFHGRAGTALRGLAFGGAR